MGPKLGHLRRLYADVFMPVYEIFMTRIGIALTTGKSSTTVNPHRFWWMKEITTDET